MLSPISAPHHARSLARKAWMNNKGRLAYRILSAGQNNTMNKREGGTELIEYLANRERERGFVLA